MRMTFDEARKIVDEIEQEGLYSVHLNNCLRHGIVTLDGSFTVEQLFAIFTVASIVSDDSGE